MDRDQLAQHVRPGDIPYRTTDPIPDGITRPQPGWGLPIRDAADMGRLDPAFKLRPGNLNLVGPDSRFPPPPPPPHRWWLWDIGLGIVAAGGLVFAVVIILDVINL